MCARYWIWDLTFNIDDHDSLVCDAECISSTLEGQFHTLVLLKDRHLAALEGVLKGFWVYLKVVALHVGQDLLEAGGIADSNHAVLASKVTRAPGWT